jgi:hypothetical protein
MADWADVRRIAMALPEVTEGTSYGNVSWRVKDKGFAWERPLGKTDLKALGDLAPDGPILAVRVADLGVRTALIADDPEVYFTIPHFDGFAAVLIRLDRIPVEELSEAIVDAWLDRAPKRLAKEFLAQEG